MQKHTPSLVSVSSHNLTLLPHPSERLHHLDRKRTFAAVTDLEYEVTRQQELKKVNTEDIRQRSMAITQHCNAPVARRLAIKMNTCKCKEEVYGTVHTKSIARVKLQHLSQHTERFEDMETGAIAPGSYIQENY